MRLLHTTSIKFYTFDDEENIPSFAILSHTWGNAEVSFQDLTTKSASELNVSEGYWKIRSCCALAAKEGIDYIWIDTCCIDKTSSAELSEAINSMYHWYRGAQVCYAYLADVSTVDYSPSVSDGGQEFRNSKWFTRGWTLQELLAPKQMVFYGSHWQRLGSKSMLTKQISITTGIWQEHIFDIGGASAAQKMSWASRRKTKRVEDIAYSLMGIFDVNMPLLYGEGRKAFTRLQHEIVKISHDESIFAWTDSGLTASGMFAQSPRAFAQSGNVVELSYNHELYERRAPYTVSNRGLAIQTISGRGNSSDFFADCDSSFILLNCGIQSEHHHPPCAQLVISIQRISQDDCIRISPRQMNTSMLPIEQKEARSFYIRPLYIPYVEDQHSFLISNLSPEKCQLWITETYGCETNSRRPQLLLGLSQISFRFEGGGSCAALLVKVGSPVNDTFGVILRANTSTVGIDSIVGFDTTRFRREIYEYKYSQGDRQPKDGPLTINLKGNFYVHVKLAKDESVTGSNFHSVFLRILRRSRMNSINDNVW